MCSAAGSSSATSTSSAAGSAIQAAFVPNPLTDASMPIVPGMCAASYFGAGRPSITSAPAAMAAASCSGANGASCGGGADRPGPVGLGDGLEVGRLRRQIVDQLRHEQRLARPAAASGCWRARSRSWRRSSRSCGRCRRAIHRCARGTPRRRRPAPAAGRWRGRAAPRPRASRRPGRGGRRRSRTGCRRSERRRAGWIGNRRPPPRRCARDDGRARAARAAAPGRARSRRRLGTGHAGTRPRPAGSPMIARRWPRPGGRDRTRGRHGCGSRSRARS